MGSSKIGSEYVDAYKSGEVTDGLMVIAGISVT